LKEGETAVPQGLQNAFDQARAARDVIRKNIRPGPTASETFDLLNNQLEEAGFAVMDTFNQPSDGDRTDVITGNHSVGNLGHGVGPSIAWFNPVRMTYTLHPGNLLSIELFAYTKVPEWSGAKVRIPLEDDAVITARGVEWLYPINQKILLIK
jgi:Xaa-Pro aminopeptidase